MILRPAAFVVAGLSVLEAGAGVSSECCFVSGRGEIEPECAHSQWSSLHDFMRGTPTPRSYLELSLTGWPVAGATRGEVPVRTVNRALVPRIVAETGGIELVDVD